MSGTELIMGMEEIVQEMSELKEALAQKFYDHYDQMNYNKLNIARTVGPNLGRMVEHLIKENKRLQEEKDDYDAMMIDAEAVDQGKDNLISSYEEDIKKLKEENKSLQEDNKSLQEELESVQPDGRCLLYEVDKLGLMVDDEREENKKLQEENKKLKEELEKAKMSDKSARMTLSETIGELEQAKEIAYECGVTLFSDSDNEDEE